MTGYVRLDLPKRSHAEYVRLGGELLAAATGHEVQSFAGTVPACWHWAVSEDAILPAGNPEKDTRAYHAVQHEKTAWLATAADRTDADVLVWLDYGLLHNPAIRPEMVAPFLARAARVPLDRVTVASIWGPPDDLPPPSRVAWHCAGGVLVVPRALASEWHAAVVEAATKLRRRGWVTWEVNDWAAAWLARPDLVRAYPCDHDATLLENAP